MRSLPVIQTLAAVTGMAALEASRVEEAMELSTLPVEGEQREPVKISDVIEKDEEAEKEGGPAADSGFACIISKISCPALEEALKVPPVVLAPSTHVAEGRVAS